MLNLFVAGGPLQRLDPSVMRTRAPLQPSTAVLDIYGSSGAR
jgi:hypothetical protein